jgi:hypothetical protein
MRIPHGIYKQQQRAAVSSKTGNNLGAQVIASTWGQLSTNGIEVGFLEHFGLELVRAHEPMSTPTAQTKNVKSALTRLLQVWMPHRCSDCFSKNSFSLGSLVSSLIRFWSLAGN